MKLVLLIAITLFSIVPSAAQNEHKQLDTLRAEGYDALFNLDYERARNRFLKMIDVAPEHPAGPQCFASSLWLEHLNEAWELQATLYCTDSYENGTAPAERSQADEFRKWIRRAKQLSEARLRKDPQDVEALYFLGAAEGLEAAFAGSVERKYRAAMRAGTNSVDHHRNVLKLSPEFRDAELTIGLLNYVVGSLPFPVKMIAATMGVRGSKKKGLATLERVSAEGQWARDVARVLLVDLYKREKRWADAVKTAGELSQKYPRNYLFKLQMADALVSQIESLRKTKAASSAEEKELTSIFTSLFRDKTLDASTLDLIHFRYGEALVSLGQSESAAKEFTAVVNRGAANPELKTIARERLEKIRRKR